MLLSIVCGCFCYFLITILSAYSLPSSYNSSMIFDWYIGALVDCYGGKFNLWILLLTVLSAALSGVNGFLLAASRLIAVMSTYHYLPKFLSYKNQHGAPVNALIMIALVAFLFIWLGRNLVVFITVDVSSVGILFSYFIICFIGIKTFKSSYFLKKLAIILLCIFFILLLFLIIPFSPLAIGTHSIYILIAWIIIGFFTKFFNMEGIEYDN